MGTAFVRDATSLKQLQSLPLEAKVVLTQQRIREWYEHFNGDVYVSFSGGKDSTVLAHLVREIYPDVPLVFSNTGLEYPEVQKFARDSGAIFVRPEMIFSDVISAYGYPIISKENAKAIYMARKIKNGSDTHTHKRRNVQSCVGKETIHQRSRLHGCEKWGVSVTQEKDGEGAVLTGVVNEWSEGGKSIFNKEKWLPLCYTNFKISHRCCGVMKKYPLHRYEKETGRKPFVGMLASESKLRTQLWIRKGCNAFDSKNQKSNPMSFWNEQDVLQYIVENGIDIASVYGEIVRVDDHTGLIYPVSQYLMCGDLACEKCQRTGCIFCGFGFHLEKHGLTRFQRLAQTHPKQYEYCLGGGQWVDNPDYDPTAPKMDGDWENWNPKKIWVPSKKGLGMKKVFDDCNEIYGKGFMRYE